MSACIQCAEKEFATEFRFGFSVHKFYIILRPGTCTQSPEGRAPFFCSEQSVPEPYLHGKQSRFTPQSAYWAFNLINNWANLMFNGLDRTVCIFPRTGEPPFTIFSGRIGLHPGRKYCVFGINIWDI